MIQPILQIGNPILTTTSISIDFPLNTVSTELLKDLYDTVKSTGDLGAGLSAPQIGINLRTAIVRNFHLEEQIVSLSNGSASSILDIPLKYKDGLLLDHETPIRSILTHELIDHLQSNEKLSRKYRKSLFSELFDYMWFFIINPGVIDYSQQRSNMWEGCLSVGVGDDALYAQIERSDEIKLEYMDDKGDSKMNIFEGFVSHVIQHEIDHLDGKLFLSLVRDPRDIWKSGDLDKYIQKYKHYPEK